MRAYLRHFWEHWSGPRFTLTEAHLDHLVSVYGPPGAFTASVQWYRAGAGTAAAAAAETTPAPEDRLATPAVVLWPEHDPLFPREWSDRIGEFFSRARLRFGGRRRALRAAGVPRGRGDRGGDPRLPPPG